ncbi:AraC family transcriptional regulator [Celeribacter naphthalenivorans]|uniref:AraC family transcriptional regulator n=1 Tax=Celeribacter naphthalenivorans TaxID=1614694 RepID=UPI001CF9DE46|nr:AraC family transcriptional regulator [Celeribacter naphthalenivorans]
MSDSKMSDSTMPERTTETTVAPLGDIAHRIDRWTTGAEDVASAIPDLGFFRRTRPTQPDTCLVEPALLVVAQGAKQMFVGGAPHRYDPSRFLITSLDIPGQTQILEASPEAPCLGLMLKLDLRLLGELVAQNMISPPHDWKDRSSIATGTLTPELLQPLDRLVALLDEPAAIPVLSPLILKEIHYRLLMSDQGARLWSFVASGSPNHRILALLNWMKQNYAEPLRVNDLAERAQMSGSSFHQHFRDLTTMSPLQYQKWLRLNEARQMMLNDRLDAASVSYQVGYESPSQFSREYARLFGNPPKRDIDQLRAHVAQ